MNGVHDMGGMTCFGPIDREENEGERPLFFKISLGLFFPVSC